jgi:signal transduction histidine kinase
LVRGDRQLRALKAIMDEVYRLFDRRCRTDTALAKLACLRQRVRRFRSLGKSLDKLASPNSARGRLERALRKQDQRKDEFLAVLAHELRNPLGVLTNSLEILRGSRNDRAAVEQAR